jgi:hypothetical protein
MNAILLQLNLKRTKVTKHNIKETNKTIAVRTMKELLFIVEKKIE